MNADNQMYREKLKHGKIMRSQTIETVLRNINFKYDREQIHTERVSQYSEAIAKAMGLSEQAVNDIKSAGVLHDIGKIIIPPEILNKPGRLTDEEYAIVKRHSETGYQILKSSDEYAKLAEYVLYHHERWDGSGYPQGLKGEEIPLQSRIISVADAYEAMTAIRPYQKTQTKEEATAELLRCAGTQFDPRIVDVFVRQVLG
jgi:putative nucleotidyltransferase with HDIG domain